MYNICNLVTLKIIFHSLSLITSITHFLRKISENCEVINMTYDFTIVLGVISIFCSEIAYILNSSCFIWSSLNVFSRWLLGLFYKGKKKGLQPEDIYDVLDGLESDQLGERLERFVFLKLVKFSTLTSIHICSNLLQSIIKRSRGIKTTILYSKILFVLLPK